MIKVLIDKYRIIKEKDELTLTTTKEYATVWEEIVELIVKDEDEKTIILSNSCLERYFHNLQQKFINKIVIENISPHKQWEELLGFRLPEEISNEQLSYLFQPEKFEKVKKIENKKLAVLCMLLEIPEFSDFKVEELLMESILRQIEKKYPQLLNDIIIELVKSLPIGKKKFWQRLKEEENKRAILLNVMKSYIVQSYPANSKPFKKYFKGSLKYSGFDFPAYLSSYIDKEFKSNVKDYLSTLKSNNYSFVSGKLREEWDEVCNFIRENSTQDKTTIEILLKKSAEYPDIYEEVQRYMPVSSPSDSINEKNIKHWIEQYFDFFLYTRLIEKPEKTEEFVKYFEDFILNHYSKITDFFTQHSILSIRQKIGEYLKKKQKVLLLVIDGLGYTYYKEIRKIFDIQVTFIFSTLPTVTKINKQRILSGLLDLNESYENIMERLYNEYRWREGDSDQLNLKDLLKEDWDLYIYWENQFDSYIHRPMKFEKRFKDHVDRLISISKEIDNFLRKGGVVFITGDHGYTTLPRNARNKIDIPNVKVKITHNRVLEISEKNKENFSSENLYWVDDDTGVARGYCYLDSFPRGATHGGTTPEEIIVPFAVIDKKRKEKFEPLKFKLYKEKYLRKKKHITKLIIDNPNVDALQINELQFKPLILKIFKPMPIVLKKGKNEFEIELDLRFTINDCKIFIEYGIAEKVYQVNIAIRTTGAIKETFDDWE